MACQPFSFRKKSVEIPKTNYKKDPKYTGGPQNLETSSANRSFNKQKLEVAIGAILTQGTSWKNAEKAIINLNRKGLIDLEKLRKIDQKNLEKIISLSFLSTGQ